MSVKRIQLLPSFQGVAASQIATLDLPIGPRYHVLWLKISNAAGGAYTAIAGKVRLKVNGKVQREAHVYMINALNSRNGSQYAIQTSGTLNQAGYYTLLPIYFAEPWRKQLAAQDGLAWGTGNLSTFQVEVELTSAASPALSAYAEVDNSIVKDAQGVESQQGLGLISKWILQTVPVTGTSVEITNLPKRDNYQQLSFFEANSETAPNDIALTDYTVKVENFVVREATKTVNDATLTARDMVPSAKSLDIVFDHDDVLSSALPMVVNGRTVQDFQVKLTLSDGTARNLTLLAQRIGPAE